MNNRVPRRYSYVLGGTSMHFPNLFMICLFRWSKPWSQRLKKKKKYWRVGLGGDLWRGVVFPLKAGSLAYIRGWRVWDLTPRRKKQWDPLSCEYHLNILFFKLFTRFSFPLLFYFECFISFRLTKLHWVATSFRTYFLSFKLPLYILIGFFIFFFP